MLNDEPIFPIHPNMQGAFEQFLNAARVALEDN
jgi:hypothetical protein